MNFNHVVNWNNQQATNGLVTELRQLIIHQYYQKALERIEQLPEVPEETRFTKLTQHIQDLEEICRKNLKFLAENELTKTLAEAGKLEESYEKSDNLLHEAYAVPNLYFITPSTLEMIHETKDRIKNEIEKHRYHQSFWL